MTESEAKKMLRWHKQGLANVVIASRLRVHPSTIRRNLKAMGAVSKYKMEPKTTAAARMTAAIWWLCSGIALWVICEVFLAALLEV